MNRYFKYVAFIVLIVGLVACGDDSTGPDDDGEPPQMPNIENGQPDVSFFENSNPQKVNTVELSETNNFTQAKAIVLWNTVFFNFGQIYGSFFIEASQEEASFNDGVWEWSYTYNYQGLSADYRTTAEELGNSIKWATYWSYDDGQGNSIENYKIFEGTVSNDGATGDWTFNAMDTDLNEEIPFITSNWNIVSETEKDITLTMYGEAINDESSNETANIDYEQNGADFNMDINFVDGENYLVTWNTDTNIGSIISDGETLCWDENFQDVPCN